MCLSRTFSAHASHDAATGKRELLTISACEPLERPASIRDQLRVDRSLYQDTTSVLKNSQDFRGNPISITEKMIRALTQNLKLCNVHVIFDVLKVLSQNSVSRP